MARQTEVSSPSDCRGSASAATAVVVVRKSLSLAELMADATPGQQNSVERNNNEKKKKYGLAVATLLCIWKVLRTSSSSIDATS